MCDSARCPQATHHRGHRTVWADTVTKNKVFIGGLKVGRSLSGCVSEAEVILRGQHGPGPPSTPLHHRARPRPLRMPTDGSLSRIKDRERNEASIRAAMDRPPPARSLPAGPARPRPCTPAAGVTRTRLYPANPPRRGPYQHLAEELELRLSGCHAAGNIPDPRDAQIARRKDDIMSSRRAPRREPEHSRGAVRLQDPGRSHSRPPNTTKTGVMAAAGARPNQLTPLILSAGSGSG